MAKSGGITKRKQLRTYVQNMNTQLKNIANDIELLYNSLNAMMKGDGETPYWNGEDAHAFYTKAVSNLKNNRVDYKTAWNRAMALGVAADTK